MKRTRYPKLNLRARYRCPEHKDRPMMFTVALRPWSHRDPTPVLFGRPSKAVCDCGATMAYEGFVRRV